MEKVVIIAEAGVNHNGSLEMALELIDVAVAAGADAVKFQTFKTENEISRNAPKAEYQTKNTYAGESQFDMVKKLELNEAAHQCLIERCRKKRIRFLSTPFDLDSLDMLVRVFDLPFLKIPSGEITNPLLLLAAGRTGKPLFLSTGMSGIGEIETALGVLAFGYLLNTGTPSADKFREAYLSPKGQELLREKVTLLHCTTEYPAPFGDVNLRVMSTLRSAFGLPVGYSDHTQGIAVSVAAVALGACVIEKHFTLDRNLSGPDHAASLEPNELAEMVAAIRHIELALGRSEKMPAPSELKNIPIARKSLVAARFVRSGELFTEENLVVKRPGTGISSMEYWNFLGKEAQRDYDEDELI